MDGRAGAGAVVAAIFLPPLGVFLARGLGPEFWIATVLTIVGWIPGIAYALYTVLKPEAFARA